MVSSSNARGLDGFSRICKRNSISNEANSHVAQNAVQRCAALLKNNKCLAETLQETRCELSTYKNLYEDSLECMSKIKLARSEMMQLSTSFKNFIIAFDEALLLMDIEDSKWLNIKASKSSKNNPKGMDTVFESTDEVEEAIFADQEMHYDEENNLKSSQQIFQSTPRSSGVLKNEVLQNFIDDKQSSSINKITSNSPQKQAEDFTQKISSFQTENAKGNDETRAEIQSFSPKKHPDSNSLENCTHASKKTKIPRSRGLTVNLKGQKFLKASISQKSNHFKRKSPQKMCKKTDTDFSRRKTFVIKSSNVLTNSESIENKTVEGASNMSENVIISKSDKRKTYVKEISNISNESEETTNGSDNAFVFENDKRKIYVKKSTNISNELEETAINSFVSENDKRKTYVKKPTNISNELEETTINSFVSENDKRKTYVKKPTNISNELEETAINSFVSENDKRKTYVKPTNISNELEEITVDSLLFEKDKKNICEVENSSILKDLEPSVSLNKIDEVVLKSKVLLNESSDIDDIFFSKSNQKTYSKKSSYTRASPEKTSECQNSSPDKECTSLESEFTSLVTDQYKNTNTESFVAFFEYPCDIIELENDKSTSAEMIEPNVEIDNEKRLLSDELLKENKISTVIHSDADKMEKIPLKLNSETDNAIPDHTATNTLVQDTDKLNREINFNDVLLKDDKVCNFSPIKTHQSFLESSESVCDALLIEEIDFSEKKPAFQTTPIRRQISKSKKKKFNFDINKRKSILKKKSLSENSVGTVTIDKNDANTEKKKSVQFISDDNDKNNDTILQFDACAIVRKETKKRKIKENQKTSRKINTGKTDNKPSKIKNKRNSSNDVEIDDLIPKSKKIKKINIKKTKNEDTYYTDDISKFKEEDKIIPQINNEVHGAEKDLETDFPCKKTGKNTFLVHAEIHAPPLQMSEIENFNEEIAKLKSQNMKVAVVLDDVLKSKDIELLNEYDKDLLYGKTATMNSFSKNSSTSSLDPNESIERLRNDPLPDTDDMCLNSDAFLNTSNLDLQSDPGHNSESTRARRRKEVNYKEPSLVRKLRRC